MKRVVIACVLFAFAISISVAGFYKTKEITNELKSKVETIYNDALEKKDIDRENHELIAYWRKKSQFMFIVLDHESVEQIEKAIFLMDIYHEKKSEEEYLESCAEALSAIEKLSSGEVPRLKNIF
ncbi:hypothetical protein SDC9_108840 [bioreactor metagenome]|uniref:DUF4363 domain-containing protein n=1 Tax=bioreactor metagenome TaxID=1076179 RepID=A0A645B968_9ZZZZ